MGYSYNSLNNSGYGYDLLHNTLNYLNPRDLHNLFNDPVSENFHNFGNNFLNVNRDRLLHFNWNMLNITNNDRLLNDELNWCKMLNKEWDLSIHDH